MTAPVSSELRWLDFSGAPPMLIPRALARYWRGTTDPATQMYRECNQQHPATDYDRACIAAWPGRSILEFNGSQVLALYSELDQHAWDSTNGLLACGGWLPSASELQQAIWTDPIRWRVDCADYLLMNSAADAACGLSEADCTAVQLPPGNYIVEYTSISAEFSGTFHRFRLER